MCIRETSMWMRQVFCSHFDIGQVNVVLFSTLTLQYMLMFQLHRQAEETETDENAHLPVMAHSSQIKTRAACNCGRKQAERDDPFDYKVSWYPSSR